MPSVPLQPTELLHYLPQYRVLICKECRYAIQPSAVSRHLKELHHIYRSNRHAFMKYTDGLDLAHPKDVTLPGPSEDPVPYLTVTSGLACAISGCDHLCATVKRMKMHRAAEHSGVVPDDSQWRPVDLQTFFRGNQLRYFIVHQSPEASSQSELHSNISSEITTSGISTPNDSTYGSCAPSDGHVIDIAELKLLEHFQTYTSQEIGFDAASRQIWRSDMPTLAAKHPFLKHGILACSALHLAFLNPLERQRYQLLAAHHQSIALPGFRSEVFNATIDNCVALLSFTQLLIMHCFAADQHDEDLLLVHGKDDMLPDWLQVIRGSCHLFKDVRPYVESVPFVAMAMEGVERELHDPGPTGKPEHEERLRGLVSMIKHSVTKKIELGIDCQPSSLASALLILTRAFAKAEVAQSRNNYNLWATVHTWPVQVSQEFLDLLKERDPAALILLAHYCILFVPLEEEHWYMKGYSRRLLSRIYNKLDEEWRTWLQWPIEKIGPPCDAH
jgi:hypothetical protein